MKVRDLIAELQKIDPEAFVIVDTDPDDGLPRAMSISGTRREDYESSSAFVIVAAPYQCVWSRRQYKPSNVMDKSWRQMWAEQSEFDAIEQERIKNLLEHQRKQNEQECH